MRWNYNDGPVYSENMWFAWYPVYVYDKREYVWLEFVVKEKVKVKYDFLFTIVTKNYRTVDVSE